MKKILTKIAAGLAIFGLIVAPMATVPVYAEGDTVETAVLTGCGAKANDPNGGGIFCLLNIVLNVLTTGVGILGTLGIVISGVQYLTARDSAEQMTKAKNRLVNIIIGLVLYAVMWGFLQWIIPGGILN